MRIFLPNTQSRQRSIMKTILKHIGLLMFCGAIAFGQSSSNGQQSQIPGTSPDNGQQTSDPASNGGHDHTSSPGTGQPGTGNVAGTGTGQGSGAEINGSPTATKKPKKTKQTKSKINSKETTPDTANSPK
jgi:hypothetical protein